MKVIYRYRTDLNRTKEEIIHELYKQQRLNRGSDWQPAEIKRIKSDSEDRGIIFTNSSYGDISFVAWKHYGIMLDTGEIFADLGEKGANAEDEMQRLVDYFESGGTEEDYIELDDIVL